MYRDRVYETSVSTGVGNFTLAGAPSGYRTFAAAFSAGQAYYVITNRDNPAEWEIGSFTISGSTLTRVAGNVLMGSAGAGVLVNFSQGTKDIFNAPPAAAMQNWDVTNASNRVLKTGDTMTGALTGTVFQSSGTSAVTNFKIGDGTDLASLFVTSASGGVGGGLSVASVSISKSGSSIILGGSVNNCNCNCNCRC